MQVQPLDSMPDANRQSFSTPVLLIMFNRPETTARVFQAIRQARPKQLFIAADGPRPEVSEDVNNCARAREIVKTIDWDCDVQTLFNEKNEGCRIAPGKAITWFFDHTEEGIILEDDCVPHPTFFPYCQELLHQYRNDQRIMMISGDNFQFGQNQTEYSYYFSEYPHIWGWATWRRAWRFYDVHMQLWPEIVNKQWLASMVDSQELSYWRYIFEETYQGRINTWDYQWVFSCWLQNGLTILPQLNLVSNIGFGDEAIHTRDKSKLANIPVQGLSFPLKHPSYILRNMNADRKTRKLFGLDSCLPGILRKIWRRS